MKDENQLVYKRFSDTVWYVHVHVDDLLALNNLIFEGEIPTCKVHLILQEPSSKLSISLWQPTGLVEVMGGSNSALLERAVQEDR